MTTRSAPRVSVVVPTYNRSHLLERLLTALTTCRPPAGGFEVIVVDDGSNDDTAAIVAAAPVDHLVYERQENAGRQRHATEVGAAARGELVAFTDDDCVPSATWLVDLVAAMDREECDGIGGRIVPLVPGYLADFVQCERLVGHGGEPDSVKYLVTANALFRRDVLDEVDGFDERFPGAAGEDTDLTYRLLEREHRLTIAAEGTVAHDHRTSWRGLFRTYYRHGRAWHLIARAHPGRTGNTRLRITTPAYWRERYGYYRREGARPVVAVTFCAVRIIGMSCYFIGMQQARQQARRSGT